MSRKLSTLEQKIHQAVLAAPNASLSQKELDALAPDAQARTLALNFLLGAGMFKALSDAKGRMVYRAVVKKELEAEKGMTGEESMVLSHIQASGNEGIWTKHIKVKTELHQTVLDRCLKSLVQKQRIKAVKSVKESRLPSQFPTRKIYMLFHLDPSVEMTGGPWYTDNELDTEFIKLLSRACLQFVKDRSFPRNRQTSDEDGPAVRRFYSISSAPAYPTSQQVQAFLSKSNITETDLTVEHVEMLLNVLVLDGEVERMPAFGAALWSSNQDGDDSDDERKKKKKKSRKDSERKRKRANDSDTDMGGDSDARAESSKKSKSKKAKSKKSHAASDSDESDDSDERSKKRGKSRRKEDVSSDEDSDHGSSKKKKSKRKKKRADTPSDSDSSDTLDSDSDAPSARRRRSKSKSSRRSPSLDAVATIRDADGLGEAFGGAAYVYRAVRPEREGTTVPSAFMSWSSQTPCARCPVFDFCKQGAPVNPTDCVYYGDWLERGVVQIE